MFRRKTLESGKQLRMLLFYFINALLFPYRNPYSLAQKAFIHDAMSGRAYLYFSATNHWYW